eukprot:10976-Heterococcus_DN1.PRE.1
MALAKVCTAVQTSLQHDYQAQSATITCVASRWQYFVRAFRIRSETSRHLKLLPKRAQLLECILNLCAFRTQVTALAQPEEKNIIGRELSLFG